MAAAALTRGEVVRIRDERWMVSDVAVYGDTTAIAVTGCERSNRGTTARYLLPFESFERLPSIATTQVVSRRRWRHRARALLARAVPSADALRTAAAADMSILPYQLEPALAVTSGLATRLLIADDVGLGKTVQAGLIVAETLARRRDAHVLVLCPAGLREQWRDELTKRFQLAPVLLDAAALRRSHPLDDSNPWSLHPLILVSSDYVKRPEVVRALEPLVWDLLVIDEAHGLAGPSDRHAIATLLAERARTVVMLTATPHSGDDRAFSRLTSLGDIDGTFPLLVFRRARPQTAAGRARRTCWLGVRPTGPERHLWHALIAYARRVWRQPASSGARLAMIVLTRRACSSALSLARSVDRRLALLAYEGSEGGQQLALPLPPAQADDELPEVQLGAAGLADAQAERRSLEAILTLAQQAATAESKLAALRRLLRRSTEPAIVFTEYRDTLGVIESSLSGFDTCQLHGGLNTSERLHAIRQFTSGERRILLATDAASEGLNLQQRCRLVVHLEVPWTPARIEQRVGRVDRIGQTQRVHQLHLVASGSVEESHVAAVARRSLRVNEVVGSFSTVGVDEQQTAAYAIGSASNPASRDPDGAAPLPTGIVTVDLHDRSAAEASRVLAARRLMPEYGSTHEPPWNARPFAAVRRAGQHRSYCALWVDYADEEGRHVWESLVGVEIATSLGRPRTALEVRRLVEALWTSCRARFVREGVLVGTAESVEVAIRREESIAQIAERRHARMASDLIRQRGLFDRRTDREAALQRELLERVQRCCRVRVAELQRHRKISVAGARPAFALIQC